MLKYSTSSSNSALNDRVLPRNLLDKLFHFGLDRQSLSHVPRYSGLNNFLNDMMVVFVEILFGLKFIFQIKGDRSLKIIMLYYPFNNFIQ